MRVHIYTNIRHMVNLVDNTSEQGGLAYVHIPSLGLGNLIERKQPENPIINYTRYT